MRKYCQLRTSPAANARLAEESESKNKGKRSTKEQPSGSKKKRRE